MLQYLNLFNFAIIENLHLDFHNGFNSVTGETGAGKSIIIDAISIACGERCGTSVIGNYGDYTKIEICFNIEQYNYLYDIIGEYIQDNLVLISREIHKNGRNVFKLNGITQNAQTIKDVCSNLIDIYGQHEHQKLFSSSYHLELLDNISSEILDLKSEYLTLYKDYKEFLKKAEYLKNNQYEIKRNIDLYTFEINEIDKANLVLGEEENLEKENEKLQNIENIINLLSEATNIINGDYGVENLIGNIKNNIESACNYDSNLSENLNLINDISINFTELSSSLNSYLDELNEGNFDFESVSSRLDLIKTLKKKYSMSVEEILAYRDKISKDLELFNSHDFNIEVMESELNNKYNILYDKALKLSQLRKDVAKDFEKSIKDNLIDLGMKCDFEVNFNQSDISSKGIDDVEFLISPNPGMPVMSLRKIASGGELSRVSLAIIINRLKEPVPLVIFDEIDAGIGGITGDKVGNKLYEISKLSQVICITHLPQIAAKSQKQFNVVKTGLLDETNVNVIDLSFDERVKVIANMFGNNSKTSLEHAKELLVNNGNVEVVK